MLLWHHCTPCERPPDPPVRYASGPDEAHARWGRLSVDMTGLLLKHVVVTLEYLVLPGLTSVCELNEEGSQCGAKEDNDLVNFVIFETVTAVDPHQFRLRRRSESDADRWHYAFA